MPEISVIVPVYQVESFLDRCIRSILGQTFQDFEIILVDDGSPDRCPEICDAWGKKDGRIRVVHQENGGQSAARNAGLSVCAGQYVSFVDADDWIEPGMFSYLYKLLAEYPQADMAQCGMVISTKYETEPLQPAEQIQLWNRDQMLDYFFRIHGEPSNYSIWNRLYRRSMLQDFSFAAVKHEDVIACMDFFLSSRHMVVSNQVFYHYFQNRHGVTATFTQQDIQYLAIWDKIVEKTAQACPMHLQYAEISRKRANFTLLAKMVLKGYDRSNHQLRLMKKELKQKVRGDFFPLMRWNMPASRKLLLILVCL